MNNQLSIYKVSGEDATQFLQGQLTQDVSKVNSQWRYAAHCNPKGRVIALFIIFSKDDNYYLVTPTELEVEAIKGIQKYIMRSKVIFEKLNYTPTFTIENSIKTADFSIENDHIKLNIPSLGEMLFNESEQTLNEQWELARIQSTVPRLYKNTIGVFTPEELNLDINDAVSFTKGCYTGQEIVARMHYLGKAKKRLLHISLKNDSMQILDEVLDNDGKKVGVVVDLARYKNTLDETVTDCLAVIKSDNSICFINGFTAELK